jgi:predicted nucleic acid-binding protein
VIVDTNALSAFADGDEEVCRVLEGEQGHQLPVIVLGEFSFGILASRHRKAYKDWLAKRMQEFEILPIDSDTAQHYAAIREELRATGTPIPHNDLWIAALARQHHLPIVSRDAHFDKVKKVKRHGW